MVANLRRFVEVWVCVFGWLLHGAQCCWFCRISSIIITIKCLIKMFTSFSFLLVAQINPDRLVTEDIKLVFVKMSCWGAFSRTKLRHQSTHTGYSSSVRTFRTSLWHNWPQKPSFSQCPWTHHKQFHGYHTSALASVLPVNKHHQVFLIKLLFLCFSSSLLFSNQTVFVLKERQTGQILTCPAWDNACLCKRSV